MKIFSHRLTYLVFLGVLTCLLVSACSKNVNQSATNSKQLLPECRVVQHGMGETCVPNNPQRLVVLDEASLGNAISLGIQPVGSTLHHDNQFPTYLKDKTTDIKPLGNAQPSIEGITLLQPDIIISWKNRHESIYPQLSSIAPTALYDWLGNIIKQDNWKEYFNFMAEVLNRKEIGQQVWQHYNQRIEKLKMALGDRYKNKTISFIIFCCGGINSETENSFIGDVLSDAGLQRPESQSFNEQGYISFSEETLEMADGDVVFVVAYGGNETGERDLSIL